MEPGQARRWGHTLARDCVLCVDELGSALIIIIALCLEEEGGNGSEATAETTPRQKSMSILLTDAYLRSLEMFKQHVSRVSMEGLWRGLNMEANIKGSGEGHGDLT